MCARYSLHAPRRPATGDGPRLVEAAHVDAPRERDAERLGAEDSCGGVGTVKRTPETPTHGAGYAPNLERATRDALTESGSSMSSSGSMTLVTISTQSNNIVLFFSPRSMIAKIPSHLGTTPADAKTHLSSRRTSSRRRQK